MNSTVLGKTLEVTIACMLSFVAAEWCGLDYAVTAGIITILSIQNTKRETLKTALNRGLAFLCALCLSAVCFSMFGYSMAAFGVYVLLFVFLCLAAGWPEAIAMDSVLISHFLASRSMGIEWIVNESSLFLIGTGFGILANLSLRRSEEKFNQLADVVDMELKGILQRMAERLLSGDKTGYDGQCFERLEKALKNAGACALSNWNNGILNNSRYELEYVSMRQKQGMVLKGVYKSIVMIETLPEQRIRVADFMKRIVADYRRDNDVEELLQELKEVFLAMKEEALPASRQEFEARAVLFYMLNQLEELLLLKNEFIKKN